MAAAAEGRVEEVLALTDPEVVWRPIFRPGRALYSGHAELGCFLSDRRSAWGRVWFEVEDIAEQAGPQVTARLRVVTKIGGSEQAWSVISVFTFRDGLVASVDSA